MAKNTKAILPQKKKWTKKKKIAAGILIGAVASFIIFIGIMIALNVGDVKPIKSTEEEARVVGTVAGYEVRYEELRYITLLHKASLDAKYGKYQTLDEETKKLYEAELESKVMYDVESNYVILSLCKDYKIDADSKKVKDHVQNEIESIVKNDHGGSMDAYKAWLKKYNQTDAFLRLTVKTVYLEGLLYDHFIANKIGIQYNEENIDKFTEYVMDNEGESWIRTIHLFYPKQSDYYDTTKSLSDAENAFSELRGIGSDGERLSRMMSLIGSAPFVNGYSTIENGFYFTEGAMGEDYESAAFALDAYGVSEVIEADEGYYVIMRVPMEENHVKRQASELLTQYRYASLKRKMDEKREKISFEGNEYFDSLKLIDIK